ncbi:hypothetical protein MMC30_001048 [Trapelia coarctata]|nr:hypothetical protein [Trapelia coarctata]
MILSSRSQQQRVLRAVNAVVKPSTVVQLSQRRHIHRVPPLTYGEQFAREGVPGLLSAGAFDMAWTQYQEYLITKLNEMTARTPDEPSQVKNLLLKHARDPSKAALFNHASMAHNNHFFFSSLANSPSSSEPSTTLLTNINNSFSSLPSLRSTFLATASALFGPGFVWLVRLPSSTPSSASSSLRILTTYLAGSPYPGAHFRQQPVDMATFPTNIIPGSTPSSYAQQHPGGVNDAVRNLGDAAGGYGPAVGYAGSMGAYARGPKQLTPGGQNVEVLLGVNTWEHVWLRDYGVGGKREYLERWWDVVDWSVVEGRLDEGIRPGLPGLGNFGRARGTY